MLSTQAERLNFSSIVNKTKYPDFLDIQIKSFQDFFQLETKSEERGDEGLYNTFMENFPITDSRNQFVLEFLDYFVDPPRYAIEECIGKKAQKNYMDIQAGDVPATWANADLLEKLTGYRPNTNFREGISKFVEWYRDYYQK